MSEHSEHVVVDASVFVDLLAGTDRAPAVRAALLGTVLHAPAHFDAEVLSALGRLQRAGHLTVGQVDEAIGRLVRAPVARHDLTTLVAGAWARRDVFRLADGLYIELTAQTGYPLLSTDDRLVRSWPAARGISTL